MKIKCSCGKEIHSELEDANEVCPHCASQLTDEVVKTETDLYADQSSTLDEVIAVVKGKIAAGIPMMTAKEEFVEDVLADAVDLFGYSFVYGER